MASIRNLFALFTSKPGTAYAEWKKHLEAVKAQANGADELVVSTHNRLQEEMHQAQNRHAVSGSSEDWNRFQNATRKFRESDAAFLRWSERSCYGAKERIEAALDAELLKRAIREASREVEASHAAAVTALEEVAGATGIDLVAARKALDDRHQQRVVALKQATISIENIAVTDRACSPRGLMVADGYLDGALAP